jgi:hypothetical protein
VRLHYTLQSKNRPKNRRWLLAIALAAWRGVGPGRTFDLPAEIRCNKRLCCRVYRTALLRGLHATVRTNVQRHAHMLSVGNRWL